MSASSLNGLNLTDREARSGMGISPDSGDSKWSQNVLKTHTKPAIAVRYSSSGQSFATAGADKKCLVYDSNGKGTVTELYAEDDSSGVNDLAWIMNDYIATVSDDRAIRVWNHEHKKCVVTMREGSQSALYCLDANSFNGLVVAGDLDGRIEMFDVHQRRKIMAFDGHSDPVASVRWHCNGRDFCSAGNDGAIRIWDSRYASCCKHTIESVNKSPLSYAGYSANGRYLLANSLGSSVCLFEISSDGLPQFVREYRGHMHERFSIQSCFFHASSGVECIVSGSEDGKIYIWDANSGHLSETIEGFEGVCVYAVASNPSQQSQQLVATYGSGAVSVITYNQDPSRLVDD